MLTQEQARTLIKDLKKQYGFTYKYLADKLNISVGHLQHFIGGTKNFRRDKLEKLERLLNTRFERSDF